MPHRPRSSSPSASCRLEWRPSRWLPPALTALVLAAIAALWLSELPGGSAATGTLLLAGWGGRRIRRDMRAPPRALVIPWNPEQPVCIDAQPVDRFHVAWRGPLAMLGWRDAGGRRQRALCGPDVLPAPLRRELRLAVQARAISPGPRSMAP